MAETRELGRALNQSGVHLAHVTQLISVCQDPAGGMAEMAPIRAIGTAAATEACPRAARATEVQGFRRPSGAGEGGRVTIIHPAALHPTMGVEGLEEGGYT